MSRPVRVVTLVVALVLVVVLLFTVVFPRVDRALFGDPTLGARAGHQLAAR